MIASKCRNCRAPPRVQSNTRLYHAGCRRLTHPDASKPSSPSSMQCGKTTRFDVLKPSSENSHPVESSSTLRGEFAASQ